MKIAAIFLCLFFALVGSGVCAEYGPPSDFELMADQVDMGSCGTDISACLSAAAAAAPNHTCPDIPCINSIIWFYSQGNLYSGKGFQRTDGQKLVWWAYTPVEITTTTTVSPDLTDDERGQMSVADYGYYIGLLGIVCGWAFVMGLRQ